MTGRNVARIAPVPQTEPTEALRAQWRAASSRRRRREEAGERVYSLTLNQTLVAGALMACDQGHADLTVHETCEELLADLVDQHLRRLIDESTDLELKVDINRLLRDFDR